MCRRRAAITAHVEIPAILGGDDADVLATRLGTFPSTPGYAHLELVRRTQSAITQFKLNGHCDRVLNPVSAPGGPDTALHRAQRLAVGVPRFHAGIDEPLPDQRELLDASTEQIDALTTGDLGVQTEIPGDLADDDELLRGDLTAGQPRHYRVGAVLLHVGQEVIVGVLQPGLLAFQDVIAGRRSQDGRHGGLADIATSALAVLGNELGEGPDSGRLHHLEQLGTRLLEMLTQRLGLLDALGRKNLLEHGNAATARGSGTGCRLQSGHIGGALTDGCADRPLGHGVARADLRIVGQRAHADLRTRWGDERGRIRGQLPAEHGPQGPVGTSVTDEDAAQQSSRIVGNHELGVGALGGVIENDLERTIGGGVRVSKAGDVDPQQFEFGGQVGPGELRTAAQ
ncbi:Uncharacterised protein [Mycobacteroides abscessus subsp. abscessus]|nr:Uncharacterised protein [Mycobacteroides abscessus subsp. abscessus]